MFPMSFAQFEEVDYQYPPYFMNNFLYHSEPQNFEPNLSIVYYYPQIPHWNQSDSSTYPTIPINLQLIEKSGLLFQEEGSARKPILKKQKKQRLFRPKKNVESNISNQVFSYITNEHKSMDALLRILKGNAKKVETFYLYISVFARSKKKYLSRKYLGELCVLTESREEINTIKGHNKENILSVDQFRMAINFLVFHYLRDKCVINLMTSIKLSSQLRIEHLSRRRQVLNFLQEYVKPDYRF